MIDNPVLIPAGEGLDKLALPYLCICSPVGEYVDMPAGTKTNGGTIPWWARWIVDPHDPQFVTAFLVHDYLVGEWGQRGLLWGADGTIARKVTWGKAAFCLKYVALQNGAKSWKAELVYNIVNLYGKTR